MTNAVAVIPNEEAANVAIFKQSTNAAHMCKEIVLKRAISLQGKRYVPVEGWQAIALAHGCVVSAENVRKVEGGYAADGVIRRMADGSEIARAEGFLGDDEKTWANRPTFAKRAMAQTRAMSRACRTAFAHVVVMMDVGLETTPAEEMQAVYEVQPAAATMRPPEEELAAWQGWARERIASMGNADKEALTKFQQSKRFQNGLEALDNAGDPLAEQLRNAVAERWDALEAQG